ncbi:ACT domain-containing protein [uncultured Gilvimarinus sp.]|uniref:glycine cleavage system protein R n=1 Tax=uncultured Gilvimarinus sp. TaxID=1689143 RepID=UPI0030EE5E20
MNQHLVLTVISADRPGVVQLLAKTIHAHHGSWLESRMAHLAGKFAGILQVAVPDENHSDLLAALKALSSEGLQVVAELADSNSVSSDNHFSFSVVGPDRTGIVAEIAEAFAGRGISVEELETDCSSMPWSGEPMFEATGFIRVPAEVDMDDLYDQLDVIADELAVDIRIEQPEAGAELTH